MAVGLAMVNYNGSELLELTLDSLQRAKVETPFVVCVVDNGSAEEDYRRAEQAVKEFASRPGADGRDVFIRSEKNLGFCGGSNLGIKTLLELEDIDRVCLLNTDVIVTDGWLDRLMNSNADVTGPVTNANGNEQTIQIDYEVSPDLNAFDVVAEFGEFRARIYNGYEVQANCVTGFCSLIKRSMIEKIGLMDERFYPGGYDDCDYDRRVHEAGGTISIRRDCYLHHWGGGSFSKLEMNSRVGISFANMIRYEQKWKTEWTGTQQLLPLSMEQDVLFLLEKGIRDKRAIRLVQETRKALSTMLKNYEKRQIEADKKFYWFDIEREMKQAMPVPEKTSEDDTAEEAKKKEAAAHEIIQTRFYPDPGIGQIATDGKQLAKTIYHELRAPGRRKETFAEVISFIREGKEKNNGTIAILAPVFSAENLKDGYFQRIYAVDQEVLPEWRKVYFVSKAIPLPTIEKIDDMHMAVSFNMQRHEEIKSLKMLLKECGTVYSHSVLRCCAYELNPNILHWMLQSNIRFIVDIHGSVPEEAVMQNDWTGAQQYNMTEEVLLQEADAFICVNHAMAEHFEEKYDYMEIRAKPVVMPIFADQKCEKEIIENKLTISDYSRPTVVYAGGLQLWQNIDLMQDVMAERKECRYDVMVPEPEQFLTMFGQRDKPVDLLVRAAEPEEVLAEYAKCHFGFVLRDDITVNRVACPTKLVEYIRYGVLPIMKSTRIGDFIRYGMQYVSLEDFRKGKLPGPETYMQMIRQNTTVLEKLEKDYRDGRNTVRTLVGGKTK